MEPNVTLHWFVHPKWFEELGGFTKEENIDIFEDWCRTAFSLFGGQPPTCCACTGQPGIFYCVLPRLPFKPEQ